LNVLMLEKPVGVTEWLILLFSVALSFVPVLLLIWLIKSIVRRYSTK